MSNRNPEIRIQEVVSAETDKAWIVAHYPVDKDKAVAICPGEALFIVARKMGLKKVTLRGCKHLVGIGRRAAIQDQHETEPDTEFLLTGDTGTFGVSDEDEF
jgi:hypothetical protein